MLNPKNKRYSPHIKAAAIATGLLALASALNSLRADPYQPPPTVAGIRGLEENTEEIDTTLRDYPAIDTLINFRLKREEVDTFVREGGLR